MKVIISHQNIVSTGYKIINPSSGINPLLLDEYLCNNEAEEIVVDGVLECVPIYSVAEFMQKLSSKLRHNGKLTITGIDARMLAWAYFMGSISTVDFNHLIHGTQNNAWSFKQSVINLNEVDEMLVQLGLKIEKKSLNRENYTFTITGVRL